MSRRFRSVAIGLLLSGSFAASLAAQPAGEPAGKRYELRVLGPDGKPLPGITVEVRSDPPVFTRRQVKRGELAGVKAYEVSIQADDDGRLVIELPREPKQLRYKIEQPGYGPYWTEWRSSEHPEVIPARLAAEVDAGWTVGGIIVDSSGQPVAAAKINPSIKFKNRPGDDSALWVGTDVTTDEDGKWKYASVPVSMRDVHVTISHADYKPERRTLSRSEFGLEADEAPAARITLSRGIMVFGTVTDETGKPIAGAVVRTKFTNELRETTTGRDGTYFLSGCEPRMSRIVVHAAGRALELQTVRVEPDMPPVDFTLKPGGKVRVRVLDENDQPLPRTRIFFQRWRGHIDYFEFDHVNEYTDSNGVWEWNEAPLDEFRADICRPGGMQLLEQPLVAREEEYVFRPPPALVVSGAVVDKATKEPIKKFRVVPGMLWEQSGVHWSDGDGYDAVDGRYRITRDRGHIAHLVRVEADGYQRATSRQIKSDEGNVTIDFELEPAENIEAVVLLPDGGSAAGAKAVLGVPGSQINIDNGAIDDGSTYARRVAVDQAGRISFPPPDEPYQLVITHPAGFAYLKSAEAPIPDSITLTPWARVEGVFKVGPRAGSGVTLNINTRDIHSYGRDGPNIFTTHESTTGREGEFVFERVMPGSGRIGRRILLMVDDGATEVTSSKMMPIDLPAGETTRVELGDDGRPVVGRLVPPENFTDQVLWNFVLMRVQPTVPQPTPLPVPPEARDDRERYQAWWNEWKDTPDGKNWQALQEIVQRTRGSNPYFTVSIGRDGSFRIDDVPPGKYELTVDYDRDRTLRLDSYRFSVPAAEGEELSEPVDLGLLTLEKR